VEEAAVAPAKPESSRPQDKSIKKCVVPLSLLLLYSTLCCSLMTRIEGDFTSHTHPSI
jgi:hypothetical protein